MAQQSLLNVDAENSQVINAYITLKLFNIILNKLFQIHQNTPIGKKNCYKWLKHHRFLETFQTSSFAYDKYNM